MIAVDTNILIYAHRAGLHDYKRAVQAIRRLTAGPLAWGLPVFVLGEFIKVATSPAVLKPPSGHEAVLDNIQTLLDSPTVRLLSPGPRYWTILRSLVEQTRVVGKHVADAQIAAVCLEHGADTLLTQDSGMRRFPGLRVQSLYDEV